MNMFVGERTGKEVKISESAENQHILELGLSGTGKSVRMAGIELERVRSGGTVIAIDTNGRHYGMPLPYTNIIEVCREGLALDFLSSINNLKGNRVVEISYIADLLSHGQNLGVRQMNALRQAIDDASKVREMYASDMVAIGKMLKNQEDAIADGVYSRLWDIFEGGFFRNNAKTFQLGKMNILSFKGINPSTQRTLIEVFIGALWRKLRMNDSHDTQYDITLTVDEVQNLSMSKNSVLFELLTEARAYGLKLLLATQSMNVFNKIQISALNQCAIKLMFKPASNDSSKLSKMMNVNNDKLWQKILENLKIGEAVAVGSLSCNGKELSNPIITTMSLERLTERRMLHE